MGGPFTKIWGRPLPADTPMLQTGHRLHQTVVELFNYHNPCEQRTLSNVSLCAGLYIIYIIYFVQKVSENAQKCNTSNNKIPKYFPTPTPQ